MRPAPNLPRSQSRPADCPRLARWINGPTQNGNTKRPDEAVKTHQDRARGGKTFIYGTCRALSLFERLRHEGRKPESAPIATPYSAIARRVAVQTRRRMAALMPDLTKAPGILTAADLGASKLLYRHRAGRDMERLFGKEGHVVETRAPTCAPRRQHSVDADARPPVYV